MAKLSTLRLNLTRLNKRLTINTAVEVRRFGQEHWNHRGVCTDISEGGLGFQLDLVLQVGEVVELRFPTADENIEYRARIIYRRDGHHYGVRFLESTDTRSPAPDPPQTIPAQ